MKLNKNSWHVKLYNWRFDNKWEELPRDFCTYFWKLVIGIVTIPISWFQANHIMSYILTFFLYFVGMMYGSIIFYEGAESLNTWPKIIASIFGGTAFLLLLVVSVTYAIFLFCDFMDGYVKPRFFKFINNFSSKEPKIEKPNKTNGPFSLLKARIKSYKDKRCPMIEWGGDDNG